MSETREQKLRRLGFWPSAPFEEGGGLKLPPNMEVLEKRHTRQLAAERDNLLAKSRRRTLEDWEQERLDALNEYLKGAER